jgi:hypothetical protein
MHTALHIFWACFTFLFGYNSSPILLCAVMNFSFEVIDIDKLNFVIVVNS